jgi:hypothetical protein
MALTVVMVSHGELQLLPVDVTFRDPSSWCRDVLLGTQFHYPHVNLCFHCRPHKGSGQGDARDLENSTVQKPGGFGWFFRLDLEGLG